MVCILLYYTAVYYRYANRAKSIKNSARINEDPKDAMLREFQKEIDDLKKMLEEGIYLHEAFCIYAKTDMHGCV